jgi:hypothetical protein
MMLRFMPDTWREALLRPLAMAAPDAGVYVEIMAPDFRFAFALGLLLLLGVFTLATRRTSGQARPALLLAAALAIAFVPWMATTSNGRYFIAGLLVVGPLCLALVWLLPITRGARLAAGLLLVALQGFAVQQSSPWQAWSLAQWKDAPYFEVDFPREMLSEPATYVTMSAISYSLLAPQLPVQSRWMNLANVPAPASGLPDSRRAQSFLAAATPGRLTLLMPFIPGAIRDDGLPTDEVLRVVAEQLAGHRLALSQPHSCQLLRSRGLATMALRREARADIGIASRVGFWACRLEYRPGAPVPTQDERPGNYDAVYKQLEKRCPRFFYTGPGSLAIPGGEVRTYPDSEMKVYVLDSGDVFYKYFRAFNPVRIGSRADVLSGAASMDCNSIRGRSGLPWEREI